MSQGLQIVLLLFAVVGYGGAGASLAVARHRQVSEGERDFGMIAVAGMLLIFGALCTAVGVGLVGVFAFGGVVVWASYVFMAQHMGLFRIEATHAPPSSEEEQAEEPRRTN
jgi:hypothetical protein